MMDTALLGRLAAIDMPENIRSQINEAVSEYFQRSSREEKSKALRAERNRKYYQTKIKPKTAIASNSVLEETSSSVLEASNSVLENVLPPSESTPMPRVRAFTVGEEVSNIPPEKATLSTPKGEKRNSAVTNRGFRLPDDWKPNDEGRRLAVEELGSNTTARREFAKFRDYWLAKPGGQGRKIDWDATWRNWVRASADRSGTHGSNVIHLNRNSNGKPSVHDAIDDIIRGFERRDGDLFAGSGGEICQDPHGLLSQG